MLLTAQALQLSIGQAADPAELVAEPKELDFSRYHQRRVALQVFYAGWDYHGFASQGPSPVETIEVCCRLQSCAALRLRASSDSICAGRAIWGPEEGPLDPVGRQLAVLQLLKVWAHRQGRQRLWPGR